jgi:hypothetical protein
MRRNLAILGIGLAVVGFSDRSTSDAAVRPAGPAPMTVPVVIAEAIKTDSTAERDVLINNALKELAPHVVKKSHPAALRSAVEAYYNFKAAHPQDVKKPYLYYIDYGLNNRTARGYVFNMETNELVDGPFIVAHGRGSGPKNAVPMRFSNKHGSAATSLGLYVTQETYNFSGKAGGSRYRSIGLRMSGESGRFNSNARARGVVVHGAPYVTKAGSGRSEGCPAMEQSRARRLLPMLANGSVVFQFSPNDENWLKNDPWVNAAE